MESIANLNGKQMPLAEVMIPALDRGFLFGDAVYEVLRVYRGRPWLVEEHFERLARSLGAIRIPVTPPAPAGRDARRARGSRDGASRRRRGSGLR